MGARCDEKLGQILKRLHFDAVGRAGGEVLNSNDMDTTATSIAEFGRNAFEIRCRNSSSSK